MKTKTEFLRGAAVAAIVAAGFATGAVAEVTLKAVSAFPRTHLLTSGYLQYIDAVNAAGKGVVQIRYLGGPEVANPREQPIGLRKGLFDMIYGPPTYYQGMFPEADLFFGNKTPMERRANGHCKLLDAAFRTKLDATVLGQLMGDIGLNLWLRKKPPMTATGMIDLTGFKVRTSPAYRDFVKALGGTAIVMRGVGAIYTALERGTIDGTGLPAAQIRDTKIHKFVKYRVAPDFLKTKILIVANAKKFDSLSGKARGILNDIAARLEKSTFEASQALNRKEIEALTKEGVQTIMLEGAAGKAYRDTFLRTPWARAAKNKKIIVDVQKAKALAY